MIDSRITIGLIAALIAMATLAYVGIQEQGRMARFETSQKAKSISTGAVIFEQSCSPCHNTDGTGIPGRGRRSIRSISSTAASRRLATRARWNRTST